VFVIAVTRRRNDVNAALTVSSRISIELEISVPNAAQRCAVGILLSGIIVGRQSINQSIIYFARKISYNKSK